MDDVDAELDKRRIGHLLEYLEGRTQTFITTSKESLIGEFAARAEIFQVRGGEATRTAPGATIPTLMEGI
jgi:recombinational DNA repair ATPase RecF